MSDNVDASLETIWVYKLFICFTVVNQFETINKFKNQFETLNQNLNQFKCNKFALSVGVQEYRDIVCP
jgi:hypothetical protein